MFSVRKVDSTDVEDVYALICELENQILDKTVFRKFFEENTVSGNNVYLVAITGSLQLVGFLSCHGQKLLHHPEMVYEIQEFVVSENFRNKGIGQLLLGRLEAILIETGCDSLEVASNIKRGEAHKFYFKNGFNRTHFKFTKRG